jgi:hypothetical protein
MIVAALDKLTASDLFPRPLRAIASSLPAREFREPHATCIFRTHDIKLRVIKVMLPQQERCGDAICKVHRRPYLMWNTSTHTVPQISPHWMKS